MIDRYNQDRSLRDSILRESGRGGTSLGLLVVSTSKINRIVISKTAVIAGLRTFESEPAQAMDALDEHRPEAILVDCAGDHAICGPLFERINAIRNADGQLRVFVITRDGGVCDHHTSADVDFLMNAPITTDRLGTALHSLFSI